MSIVMFYREQPRNVQRDTESGITSCFSQNVLESLIVMLELREGDI